MVTITIQVFDRLDSQTASLWDSLCDAENRFSSHYLQAIARAELACSFRYFIARQGEKAVGASFGYFMNFPILSKLNSFVFISGSPANTGFPFTFQKDLSREKIFMQLVHAMVAEAQKQRAASMILRDIESSDDFALVDSPLNACGFRLFPLFQHAHFDVRWPTFDAYIESLRSKPRYDIRRDFRQIAEHGYQLDIVRGSNIQPYLTEMARMWTYLYDKHQDPDQLYLPISYFRQVTALPECVVFLVFHGKHLVAFGLTLERGSCLEYPYCGIDYAATGKDSVNRYLGYEVIRYAISRGFKTIDFGISNEETKLRYGCALYGSNGYIRPLSPLAKIAARVCFDRVILRRYGFSIPCPDAQHVSPGYVQPTVFKSERNFSCNIH